MSVQINSTCSFGGNYTSLKSIGSERILFPRQEHRVHRRDIGAVKLNKKIIYKSKAIELGYNAMEGAEYFMSL